MARAVHGWTMERIPDALADRLEIRELIDNWALWRDAGAWEKLATLWHPRGRMTTTWVQASAEEFIARSRRAFDNGLKALHMLGGTNVEIAENRAVAQTRMQIIQRAELHNVLVDVVCYGRFWDALEKVNGAWLLRLRQPIYELDHIIPVDPAAKPALDRELLAAFSEGYRKLAYLQTQLGFEVSKTMPGTRGPEIEALQACGRLWLAGQGGLE
jgi:hypothetical protein